MLSWEIIKISSFDSILFTSIGIKGLYKLVNIKIAEGYIDEYFLLVFKIQSLRKSHIQIKRLKGKVSDIWMDDGGRINGERDWGIFYPLPWENVLYLRSRLLIQP